MKKLAIICVAIFLIGCTPKAYTEQLGQGLTAFENEQYDEAYHAFDIAHSHKDTQIVQQYMTASDKMSKASSAYEEGAFDKALSIVAEVFAIKWVEVDEKVINTIEGKAQQLQDEIELIVEQEEELQTMIEAIDELLTSNNFDQALALLATYDEEQYKKHTSTAILKDNLRMKKDEVLTAQQQFIQQQEEEEKRQEAERKQKEEAEKKRKIEEQKAKEAAQRLTAAQAEKLVRTHVGADGKPDVYVNYDHDNENGDYVIQVYNVIITDAATGEGHTATWGWFGVNPKTKEIYDAMDF